MTDIRAFTQNLTPGRAGAGTLSGTRQTSDGALYVAPYSLAAVIEGRVFGANAGVVTTPAATAATTALATTTPHLWVRVPDGTVIVPLALHVIIESTGITTQGEAAIFIAQNDVGNGTSSAADAGPLSLNTAAPLTSNCTARQLATAAVTALTNPLELKRFSFAVSAVNQVFDWVAASELTVPVLRGPSSWLLNFGGNAVNFFATMIWAEYPESAVT